MPDGVVIPDDKRRELSQLAITLQTLSRLEASSRIIAFTKREQKALMAYVELASLEGEIRLAAEDVKFFRELQPYLKRFSDPGQLPLFGERFYQKIVEAKNFLDQIIPKEILPEQPQR